MQRAVRNIIQSRYINNTTNYKFDATQAEKLICKVEKRHSDESDYNECQNNAFQEHLKNDNVKVCMGWLVSKWDSDKESAHAVYHYWNHDTSTDTFYDTTPMREGRVWDTYLPDNIIHKTWYDAEENKKSVMEDVAGNKWMFPALICHKNDRVEFSMMRADGVEEIKFDVEDLSEQSVKEICKNIAMTLSQE